MLTGWDRDFVSLDAASMQTCLLPALLLLLTVPTVDAQSTSRPSVLLIFVDDLCPALGCYGDPLARTPHIDRFATTARRFERAYCHQAVCGPSRTSVLTGRLPDHTGVWHNRNRFRDVLPDLQTLPQLFRNHGWASVSLGKVFSGDERELDPPSWSRPEILKQRGWQGSLQRDGSQKGKGQPFEAADVPDAAYADGRLADLAVQTLEELGNQTAPFFLAVGFFKPHLPFNAPKSWWEQHNRGDFAAAVWPTGPRPRGAPDFAFADHHELAGYRDIPDDEQVSAEQLAELRHGYYACVSYIDAQVGRLLETLEKQRLSDRTIVVLLGDHGYSLAEAGRWCKASNFEQETRVPLLIRTPGMRLPGEATAALTELVDLYPTLAELAGLPGPEGLDGRSLSSQLHDPAAPGRELVLSQFSRPFAAGTPEVMGYSIRTSDSRYTRWLNWSSRSVLAEEYYDYSDPQSAELQHGRLVERASLLNDPEHADAVARLRQALDRQLAERLHPVSVAAPRRKRQQPQALGEPAGEPQP